MYPVRQRQLQGFGYIGDIVPVRAGQTFYYSANIDGKNLEQSFWAGLLPIGAIIGQVFSTGGWPIIASRVLSAVSGVASGRVVGADKSNITLALTAKMDRASQSDLQGNVDQAIAAQPEVNKLLGSMMRLTDASLNPTGDKPLEITPTMWAVIGIGLFLLLRR